MSQRTKLSFSTLLAVLSVACALVVTVAVVRRELSADPRLRPRSIRDYAPVPVDNWEELVGEGRRIGPDSAALTIVEFADFQCPACRYFHESVLMPVMLANPGDVALVFHHWPLPYHADAYDAARVAECAAHQDAFPAMVDALYHWQDSIGRTGFDFFAEKAQIRNRDAFNDCAASEDSVMSITRGMALANRLGGSGTPTLVVNGDLLRYVPDSKGLVALLAHAKRERAR